MLSINVVCEDWKTVFTERRGRMVNTPTSYLGGAGLKSRSGDQLACDFRGFTQSLQEIAGIVP
jgi:hypothetical protein